MADEVTAAKVETAPENPGDPPEEQPKESKWYLWRHDGVALIHYLLDSEVHTFAFSVAANAIISFIPFAVLLYTLAISVFHSEAMRHVVDEMVNYYLPTAALHRDWLVTAIFDKAVSPLLRHKSAQVISVVMILIACTGIFLPLEVALNQAWGVTKSRNYLLNQTIAFGLV
ncbi:MAG: YhjD/YihY/BrkB family envelope integrity protein, partial [Terracidiphilus sp.]